MLLSLPTVLLALSTLPIDTLAFPTMGSSLMRRISSLKRNDVDLIARVPIGDLKKGITTPVGQSVYNIIMGDEDGYLEGAPTYIPPGLPGSAACRNDTCCIWSYVAKALTVAFTGPTGRCNALARQAIRLGFHDAGPWSSSLAAAGQDFGGADGSIVLNSTEAARADNNGLADIINKTYVMSKLFNVGVADLVQFQAKHAVVTCPLGPRLRVFVGRKDSSQAAPPNLMPAITQSNDDIIAMFQDKTIVPHDLAALLGAHSASQQFHVNTTLAGEGLDSTPGVWDVNFYNETLQPAALPNVFRFPSDIRLSVDSRVNDEWTQFVGNQSHWNEDFATAYVRLSMLGVNNINNLTECTKVMPANRATFANSNQPGLLG